MKADALLGSGTLQDREVRKFECGRAEIRLSHKFKNSMACGLCCWDSSPVPRHHCPGPAPPHVTGHE